MRRLHLVHHHTGCPPAAICQLSCAGLGPLSKYQTALRRCADAGYVGRRFAVPGPAAAWTDGHDCD